MKALIPLLVLLFCGQLFAEDPALLTQLEKARATFEAGLAKLDLEDSGAASAQKRVAYVQRFGKYLAGMQEKLTKASMIEAAVAVRDERKALATHPSYLAAKKLLDAEKARLPPGMSAEALAGIKSLMNRRVGELFSAAASQDADAAAKLMAPAEVKKLGKERALKTLRNLHPFLTEVEGALVLRATEFDFGPQGRIVQVDATFTNGPGSSRVTSPWIREGGQWYYDLGAGLAEHPDALAREERGRDEAESFRERMRERFGRFGKGGKGRGRD